MIGVYDFGVFPHPYGVLPSGNAYTGGKEKDGITRTTNGHQEVHSILSDEVWQKIMSFCDGPTLGNLIQTCRIFYVAGHQPELWRDLMLRDVDKEGGNLDRYGQTWKDTFIQKFVEHKCHGNNKEPFLNHTPIAIPRIYSDHFFRTHLCRSFGFPSSWMKPSNKRNEVDRVTNLSTADFLLKYEQPNRPVVLAGVAKSWRSVQKWGNVQYLNDCTNGRTFRATSGAAPFPAFFSIESYKKYCQSTDLEEAPLYLFDRSALLKGPLREDYYPDLKQTCPYFDPEECTKNGGHDLFQLLGDDRRPDHTWLIMGPKRSGSAFHIDPNATHAWNAAVVGRKRWLFYPPGTVPPGVHPSPSGDEVAMPISIGEWLVNFWAEHEKRRRTSGALECTVEPGDVVFVPHGWWHMVINLDDINIAVTHNYVSKSNLPTVLRFLEKKKDQVSGCRDRAKSVKPEHLHETFTKALLETYPEWLKDAQEVAKQGWKNRAWTDATNDVNRVDNHMTTMQTKRKRPRIGEKVEKNGTRKSSIIARAKVVPTAENSVERESKNFSFSFM